MRQWGNEAMTRLLGLLCVAGVLGSLGCRAEPAVAPAATAPPTQASDWFSNAPTGRSPVRATGAMVASSQPLASQVGLEILKRGGNAVDAAIAMAAMLNVTEPSMTGIGGDAFMMVYSAKTKKLEGLNASGRAPKALNTDYFAKKNLKSVPFVGMESITVPGAFDGWVTLLEKHGTMKLADLLQPAINYAENGFPLEEKIVADWQVGVRPPNDNFKFVDALLVNGAAPKAGHIFVQKNLAKTFRALAAGGRDAFYRGPVGQAIVDYMQKNGGFLTMEDLAAQKSEWVEPISTTYRGYTLYELPPNGQGLTALIMANILDGVDVQSMKNDPVRYYHTIIEATKIAFADRNHFIADPLFQKTPVTELLAKDYAAKRRAMIDQTKAIDPPAHGDINVGGDTTYFTVVDKDRNAVSFINSIFQAFGSGVIAGDTGIIMQDRGAGFSVDPANPNRIEPGKRPFHTLVPAMVFKDGNFFMSYGVMGGDVQPQGHVQVLMNLVDRGLNLQEAIDAPRVRYVSGKGVMMDEELTQPVIEALKAKGHVYLGAPAGVQYRALMGGGQAIMIDPATGTLVGGSDKRKDGLALGY
jgi:gamma-glutamyltranspeptidase/glutathione hydrolase